MDYPKEQTDELKRCCKSVSVLSEGGVTYFQLEGLRLPPGCDPAVCDALLCPATGQSNYPSRLYFAVTVKGNYDRNWNGNVRVGEKNWVAFSWKDVPSNLPLVQILNAHLSGFTRAA